MTSILLLGAGFSYPFGGWLASEVLEYLIGSSHVDDRLRKLLIDKRSNGGFEGVLEDLQREASHSGVPHPPLAALMNALVEMFAVMNRGLDSPRFPRETMGTFLAKFDAIFTLNQDTLLEAHYVGADLQSYSGGKWKRAIVPGMQPRETGLYPYLGELRALDSTPSIGEGFQPYVKLHGSSNWRTDSGGLMIVGGNKFIGIRSSSLLDWNFRTFEDYLRHPECRLMVVGYSFRDNHINNAIAHAINAATGLQIFIVDPIGLDVVDPPSPPRMQIPPRRSDFTEIILPSIRGCSRRDLLTTWATDVVERSKILNFLKSSD